MFKSKSLFILMALIAALAIGNSNVSIWAEEDHHEHDHEHGTEEHDDHEGHEDHKYLYGNHYCPVCNYADLVDPHAFAKVSNKSANVYGRIYLCHAGCAEEIEKNMAKYYIEVYRTDRESGEEKELVDLENDNCPMSDEAVDGETAIEYNGMKIHFCCEGCAESFLEEPEPAMAKLLPEKEEFKFEGLEDHDEGHEHDHDHEHGEE